MRVPADAVTCGNVLFGDQLASSEPTTARSDNYEQTDIRGQITVTLRRHRSSRSNYPHRPRSLAFLARFERNGDVRATIDALVRVHERIPVFHTVRQECIGTVPVSEPILGACAGQSVEECR